MPERFRLGWSGWVAVAALVFLGAAGGLVFAAGGGPQ